MSRAAEADGVLNRLMNHVLGNKEDAAVGVAGSTASVIGYLKGMIGIATPGEVAGEADIDISEADYTAFQTLLTIAPAAGAPLADLVVDLDWNKATTGFDTVATAADTLDVCVQTKTDGTNWRTVLSGTQITANGDGSLEAQESGERLKIGAVGVTGQVRVLVKVSTERGDCEIPYRVLYRASAAPTITAVAAA